MARIAQIDGAETREGHAVPAIACRQHAVEHIDAALYRFEQVLRSPYSHQITRPILREVWDSPFYHFEHHRLRLADRKPADRISVEADVDESACGSGAQCGYITALDYAEQHIAGWRRLERAP